MKSPKTTEKRSGISLLGGPLGGSRPPGAIPRPKASEERGTISLRLLLGIALALLPLVLLAQAPQWWYQDYAGGTAPVRTTGTSDYAAVNQGQLKNLATAAVAELDASLPDPGAGDALHTLVYGWTTPTVQTNDYAAVNLGQLKNVAKPFLDRLLEVGYQGHPLESGTYPWVGGTANDYAMANIGQVKNLFSFDVALCTDGSGLPDWWRQYYNIVPGTSGTCAAPRGDGLSYLDAYQQGLNPLDFYNGQAPTLTITSGNNQTGLPGSFVFSPLVVKVTDSSGEPLAHAPVTFTTGSGGGTLQATSGGINAAALTLRANAHGYAIVYFQLPNTPHAQCQITCALATGTYSTSVTFSESSDDGSGSYPTPILPPDNLPDDPSTPPVVSYPAIDMSGEGIPGTIVGVALDDNNNGAYVYEPDDAPGPCSRRWETGQLSENINCAGLYPYSDENSGNLYYPYGYFGPDFPSPYIGVGSDGTIYGNMVLNVAEGNCDGWFGFRCADSTRSEADDGHSGFTCLPHQDPPPGLWMSELRGSTNNGYFGISTYLDNDGSPYDVSFVCLNGTVTGTWGQVGQTPEFFAIAMSGSGCAIGYDSNNNSNKFWDGHSGDSPVTTGDGDWLVAVNNQGQAIGSNSSGWFIWDATWTPNTHKTLASLIPSDYQGQISNITGRILSNADPDGIIHILLDATFTDPTDGTTSPKIYVLSGPHATLSSTTCDFQEVQLPDGLISSDINHNSDIRCINANGVLAFIHNDSSGSSMTSNTRTANAATQSTTTTTPAVPAVGIAPSPDISITFGYGPYDRDDQDQNLAQASNLVSSSTNGDIKTYVYNGKDSSGNPKLWTVQTSSNADSFLNALKSVPYAMFMGHSNFGLGAALKQHETDPAFDPNSVTGLNSFLPLRNPQTAVNLHYLSGTDDYPRFNTALPSSAVPKQVANYPVTGFADSMALQYPNGTSDRQRYPNDDGVTESGTFTLKKTGNGRYHLHRKSPESGNEIPFMIVNSGGGRKSALNYKILFYNSCSSDRDYSEYFNHGNFIGTTVPVRVGATMASRFVLDIMKGCNASDISDDFNQQYQGAANSTKTIYASKSN